MWGGGAILTNKLINLKKSLKHLKSINYLKIPSMHFDHIHPFFQLLPDLTLQTTENYVLYFYEFINLLQEVLLIFFSMHVLPLNHGRLTRATLLTKIFNKSVWFLHLPLRWIFHLFFFTPNETRFRASLFALAIIPKFCLSRIW